MVTIAKQLTGVKKKKNRRCLQDMLPKKLVNSLFFFIMHAPFRVKFILKLVPVFISYA